MGCQKLSPLLLLVCPFFCASKMVQKLRFPARKKTNWQEVLYNPFLRTMATPGFFSSFFLTHPHHNTQCKQRHAAAVPPPNIDKMDIAACVRQSALSGFKQQSNPTIGCQDIGYLPLVWPGGTAAACLGLHCVLWCTCIKKTEINLGWPCFQEIGNMCDMENITYVSWKKYQEKKQV